MMDNFNDILQKARNLQHPSPAEGKHLPSDPSDTPRHAEPVEPVRETKLATGSATANVREFSQPARVQEAPSEAARQERPRETVQAAHAQPAYTRLGKGLDIGTANLVSAVQNADGGITIKMERNAFIDINSDVYSKNMLTKLQVPYVIHNKKFIVLGEAAFELANIFSRETRRPMRDGFLSPKESDALPMVRLIIEEVLGDPQQPGEVVHFSIPAPSIDRENNVIYHEGVFSGLIRKMGFTPKSMNEGHAIVFSELADEDFTGIGISCGGGMFNICVAYKTISALAFSISRAGDWIDKNVATVLGIPVSQATYHKEKGVNLTAPKGRIEEAIVIYYRNLINYTLTNIKNRFEQAEGMPVFPKPIEIVCSGGTSLISGFIEVFKEEFHKIDFPLQVKNIRLAKDPLTTVAKGCLVAAAIGE